MTPTLEQICRDIIEASDKIRAKPEPGEKSNWRTQWSIKTLQSFSCCDSVTLKGLQMETNTNSETISDRTSQCVSNSIGEKLANQMTLREYFAAMAVQGQLGRPLEKALHKARLLDNTMDKYKLIAKRAVWHADALIEALREKNE